jgi:hypothetical protein
LGLNVKSTSPVINRILWTLLAVGVVSLFIGVTFAGGPWSVQAEGERLGCGMPFMGRYAGQPLSSVDPMARAAYFCYLQASNRRIMAFWFGGVGLLVLFVAVGWISLTTLGEGRTSPGTEPAYVE